MGLLEAYQALNLDGSAIGLEPPPEDFRYFCTPEGAEVFGWDNGIHYCFVDGFGETVFCVNPESCCDQLVYPLAPDFRAFLALILSAGGTNPLQQIVWWSREEYEAFQNEPAERAYRESPEVQETLRKIRGLGVLPAADPYGEVRAIQKGFDSGRLRFSPEYYDVLGLPCPDGTEAEPVLQEKRAEISAEII